MTNDNNHNGPRDQYPCSYYLNRRRKLLDSRISEEDRQPKSLDPMTFVSKNMTNRKKISIYWPCIIETLDFWTSLVRFDDHRRQTKWREAALPAAASDHANTSRLNAESRNPARQA